jgi:hypothetical protein
MLVFHAARDYLFSLDFFVMEKVSRHQGIKQISLHPFPISPLYINENVKIYIKIERNKPITMSPHKNVEQLKHISNLYNNSWHQTQ